MYGYTGKIIEIDLETGKYQSIEIDDTVYRRFLGGRGLATYILAKRYGEIWKKLDPLSPDNPLIVATGPLTGYYPGIKLAISGKSPQSNGVIGSTISSEVAVELKACGYDALIINGSSDRPVIINIVDGRVDIRDAGNLWGLQGRDFIERMADLFKEEYGYERPPSMLYIGPAGENSVRTAVVSSKLVHAAGYGGYGAVMGSKRIKAIIVKGNAKLPPVYDYDKFLELRTKTIEQLVTRLQRFRHWGTTMGTWYHGYYTSSIPVRNWQEEYHADADFSPHMFELKTWVKNPWADHGCPVGCMKISRVEVEGKKYITDGPDYEMAAYLGSNLGVFKPEHVVRLSSRADELGLCGIQTGNTIGLAIELYEKGILSKEDTGYELKWGDPEVIEKILDDIAYRRSIGKMLAEGTYRFAKMISSEKRVDVLQYAVQVKGVGIGAHGIRSGKDYPQLIAYTCSVQGGDHTSVAGLPVKSTESEAWAAILDSLVICLFLDPGEQVILDYLNAVTGWNLDMDELFNIGARTLTLQRILLLLGGPDAYWSPLIHDENPARFYEPLPSGPFKGSSVSREKVVELKVEYYRQLGWDSYGIPLPETMDKLDLGEFKELLLEIPRSTP